MKRTDPELDALAAAEERAQRHRMILRISELTGRVPSAVLQSSDARRVVSWRDHARRAARLIEQRAPATQALRTALSYLEQYER